MNNKAGIHLLNSSVESAVTKKVYIYLHDTRQTNGRAFRIKAGSETAVYVLPYLRQVLYLSQAEDIWGLQIDWQPQKEGRGLKKAVW